MNDRRWNGPGKRRLRRWAALLPVLLVAGNLQAGAKVKMKGSVEEVATRVDGALKELALETSETSVDKDGVLAIARDENGIRLQVAVRRLDEGECEVEFGGDSPDDAEIEERFLRLMRTR